MQLNSHEKQHKNSYLAICKMLCVDTIFKMAAAVKTRSDTEVHVFPRYYNIQIGKVIGIKYILFTTSHGASTYINDNVKSLFTRVFSTYSPTRDVCIHFINLFVTESLRIPGTLIDRIVKMGISPTSLLRCNNKRSIQTKVTDGLVDSLSAIL